MTKGKAQLHRLVVKDIRLWTWERQFESGWSYLDKALGKTARKRDGLNPKKLECAVNYECRPEYCF